MTPDTHADAGIPGDAGRIAELEDDNRRLRRLLEQRDAPGELRHRLRSTLSLLRAVIRRSAETDRDLAGYVAHLEDRLDAITRAQAFADEHGEVDLRSLIADELLEYAALEGEKVLLAGPEVRLQPRAGQVMALALHELAVNAVEHGALGMGDGQVEVSWEVAGDGPETMLVLGWTERGMGGVAAGRMGRQGFGTEVLTRMLAYDLRARTDLALGPDGLCCTVRLPLPGHVGRLLPG